MLLSVKIHAVVCACVGEWMGIFLEAHKYVGLKLLHMSLPAAMDNSTCYGALVRV